MSPLKQILTALVILLALAAPVVGAKANEPQKEKLKGYLEWRQGEVLIIEGQRVLAAPKVKFKGQGGARSLAAIPIGYVVEVHGVRRSDGAILAKKISAKPNGRQAFEMEVLEATNQLEAAFRKAGQFHMVAGDETGSLGKLHQSGPQVDRVRRIIKRLLPPYLEPEDIRVYVIENDEWNALAMGNYSFYVFSGLLEDTDDDELALVLGHELVHATHEHTRRQHKRNMWIELATIAANAAINELDEGSEQDLAGLLVGLGATAFANGYSRNQEDQADRVGMRYAYEAGFDVSKGPQLWQRFAERYGDYDKVSNILFGNHSRSSFRAKLLYQEIRYNYRDTRDDVKIVERPDYYQPKPAEEQSPTVARLVSAEKLPGARKSRVVVEPTVLAAAFEMPGEEAYVPVLVEIDGESLMEGSAGIIPVEIHAYALDAHGTVHDLFESRIGLDLDVAGAALQRKGFKYWGHFDLGPGDYRVKVMVRNEQTGVSGVATGRFKVPSSAGQETLLLPPFFPEPFDRWVWGREVGADRRPGVQYPFHYDGQPFFPAARPEVRGGQEMSVSLIAYNLGVGELAVGCRVFDSRVGEVADGGHLTLNGVAQGSAGLSRLEATFKAGNLEPGDYILQVEVRNLDSELNQSSTIPLRVVSDS